MIVPADFIKNMFDKINVRKTPVNILLLILKIIEQLLIIKVPLKDIISAKTYLQAYSASVTKYCSYNKKVFVNSGDYAKGYLLMDCFAIPMWIMTSSVLLNRLSEITGAGIATYDFTRRSLYVDKLFSSFGANKHLELKLTRLQRKRRTELFKSIVKKLETKKDLHDLTIDGVKIGVDIYESILRTGLPTVDINSFVTYKYLYYGLRYFIFFQDMMQKGKIKAVVLSHDCYINTGILEKLAYFYSVPAYYANVFEIIRTDAPYQIHKRFLRYPEYFDVLTDSEKETGLRKANSVLNQRLGGETGVKMSYQTKSAFTSQTMPRQTNNSNKIKIIIATHCFYDNPTGYGGNLFLDFYEWLMFLGEMTLRTDYEWYIKPHRDYRPGTLEIIDDISKKYPALKLIDPETSFHQLRDEGASIALTCYGSIGHELPYIGYQVINAGYNPHIAFDFNIHCGSISEYEECLLNLQSLSPVSELERLPEFYYIHYFIMHTDDYFFDSYQDFIKFVNNDVKSVMALDYFMENADRYVGRYRAHVNEMLSSKCRYSCELEIVKRSNSESFKPQTITLSHEVNDPNMTLGNHSHIDI